MGGAATDGYIVDGQHLSIDSAASLLSLTMSIDRHFFGCTVAAMFYLGLHVQAVRAAVRTFIYHLSHDSICSLAKTTLPVHCGRQWPLTSTCQSIDIVHHKRCTLCPSMAIAGRHRWCDMSIDRHCRSQ